MSDNEIIAASRQWAAALAKQEKLQADVNRLEAERQKAYTLLNDSQEYVKRCETTVRELVKRGAKVPEVVEVPPPVKPALPQGGSGTAPPLLKPGKVRTL